MDGVLDIVYQLKFFPEGFSGGFRDTRRRQITNSFNQAMKLSPRRWVLVVPRDPTPKERSWVHRLAGKQEVEIAIWGQAKLDSELAKRSDLLAWATREPLVDTLKVLHQEQAGLVRASDLTERLGALRDQVSGRSAYWDVAFQVGRDGAITETLYGKTADAHIKEPIRISFHVDGAALDATTRTAWERLNHYGAGGVDLPADAVTRFEIDGPEWIARTDEGGRLQIGPRPRLDEPVILRTVDEEGFTLQSVRAVIAEVGVGSKGQSLSISAPGGLELLFLIDTNDPGCRAEVTQEVSGHNASDVYAAMQLVESMATAALVQVMRGSTPLMGVRPAPSQRERAPVAPAYDRQLVEDLAIIAAYASIPFDVPERLTAHARTEIRRLRLLLDGAVVIEPAFGTLTSTLSGELSEEILGLLGGPVAVAVTVEKLEYDVLGHHIPVRDVVIYSPRAVAQDGDALGAAITAGTSAGASLVMRGVDGESFWAYMPSRMNGDTPVFPTALDIPGIDEPPLPNRTAA
ncbi:hypothetical protein CCO02nite_30620 [Cellulomonas composti]|uniref:Uncharacterized protein n=1 Tax=Cellulomonas composti TaxID=266130 RepID=A0A511JEJ0_9CELL|nr:hypothetical protein CCO02nite_30620 [Cellulomonas composti]